MCPAVNLPIKFAPGPKAGGQFNCWTTVTPSLNVSDLLNGDGKTTAERRNDGKFERN